MSPPKRTIPKKILTRKQTTKQRIGSYALISAGVAAIGFLIVIYILIVVNFFVMMWFTISGAIPTVHGIMIIIALGVSLVSVRQDRNRNVMIFNSTLVIIRFIAIILAGQLLYSGGIEPFWGWFTIIILTLSLIKIGIEARS